MERSLVRGGSRFGGAPLLGSAAGRRRRGSHDHEHMGKKQAAQQLGTGARRQYAAWKTKAKKKRRVGWMDGYLTLTRGMGEREGGSLLTKRKRKAAKQAQHSTAQVAAAYGVWWTAAAQRQRVLGDSDLPLQWQRQPRCGGAKRPNPR